ncbi:hypothetical protein F5B21DRAFT_493383 [Xylaria acuta]|nr:hypothetical protein F5B21DRAFT_493383 [Xylaria acuta]
MAFTQRARRSNQPTSNAESNGHIGNGSNPDVGDDINTARNHSRDTAKRQRSRNEDSAPAACDQCRSRKVRCDRQQPECSNCRKATVFCSWSSPFKRVNHTKQLRDDFSSVMGRLDEVHQTLNQLARMTRDIVARPSCHGNVSMSSACDTRCATMSSTSTGTSLGATTATTTASTAPSITELIATLHRGSSSSSHFILSGATDNIFGCLRNGIDSSEDGHLLQDTSVQHCGGEHLSDSPASLALMQDIARQISAAILRNSGGDGPGESRAVGVQVALQHLRTSFPFEKPCPDLNIIDDSRPVSTPPRLMVDLFIESFLSGFNACFPIFDEAELRCAVDAHYAAEYPVDNSPWALIFTNIVILGLGREAQAANISRSHPKSMHHELTSSFIRNCDRAIANLDSFARPSVVNIQAILTLALVGKEFYGNTVFEKACQTACHLARITGLHRSRNSRTDAQDTERADQDRLFRVLYSMDKFRTFLTGNPCDLYLFDLETQFDKRAGDESRGTRLDHAFDHMMRVWEEIYLNLYSTRASSAGVKIRAQRVSNMSGLVACWAQQYGELMESADLGFDSELEPRHLELKYCYHITQVMILRCDRRNHFQEEVVDHARACLRVIAGIVNMPVTMMSLASLVRMLQNYPAASFTELLRFHLHNLSKVRSPDEMASEDVKLFRYISRSIEAMRHPDSPQTHLSQLGVGINWLLQVLETVAENTGRPLNASDNQKPTMPVAYVDSSSSRPPSHSASDFGMTIDSDSIGFLRPSRGCSLASPTSSSSEKEHKHPLSETELTSFGVHIPLTDPISITTGKGPSSGSGLYLDGPHFDSFMVGGQNWGMSMDLWKDMSLW